MDLFHTTGIHLQSSKDILDLVSQIGSKHGFEMRKNPYDAGVTFAKVPLTGTPLNREDATAKFVEYVHEAKTAKRGKIEDAGISASIAARGCGKSLIIDHFAQLHNQVHEDSGEFVLGGLNNQLVPVCITFNGDQSDGDKENMSGEIACYLRVIHSAFFNMNTTPWDRFLRVIGVVETIDTTALCEALFLHFESLGVSEPIIFLAIDEVVKSADGKLLDRVFKVIHAAKKLLDIFPNRVRLFMTTFDDKMVMDGTVWETTGSNRPIEWIPLPPLDLPPLEPVWKVTSWYHHAKLDSRDKLINYLVSLSGGHPRSLALLSSLLGTCEHTMNSQEVSWCNHLLISELRQRWLHKFLVFVPQSLDDHVLEQLLLLALCGDSIRVSDKIANWTVSELLHSVALINEIDPTDSECFFVPQLSLLRLDAWCRSCEKHSQPSLRWCLRRLRLLIDLGENLDSGASFERFLCYLEELRSWAFCQTGRHKISIGEYWNGAHLLKGDESHTIVIPSVTKNNLEKLPVWLSQCSEPLQPGHY